MTEMRSQKLGPPLSHTLVCGIKEIAADINDNLCYSKHYIIPFITVYNLAIDRENFFLSSI